MKMLILKQVERVYKNSGQHAEQVVRYTLTGTICKADNISHEKQGDVLNIQVKSARATVCKGTNLLEYLSRDAATEFGYVVADFSKMYIMNKDTYIEFVNLFGTVTRESQKNGGGEKIRLKSESKAMLEWLEKRATQ